MERYVKRCIFPRLNIDLGVEGDKGCLYEFVSRGSTTTTMYDGVRSENIYMYIGLLDLQFQSTAKTNVDT
jgi:hypothetical protein